MWFPPLFSWPNAVYRLLPMNLRLVKLNHHLLGFESPSSYTRASSRVASSCRHCDIYNLSCSASWRSRGGSYICFPGVSTLFPCTASTQQLISLVLSFFPIHSYPQYPCHL